MAAAAFANAVRAKAASVSSADMKLLAGDAAPEDLADAFKLAKADWSEVRDIILARSAFLVRWNRLLFLGCARAGRICVCSNVLVRDFDRKKERQSSAMIKQLMQRPVK